VNEVSLSDKEYGRFRNLIRQVAGINLTQAKKAMVCGRLSKRLQQKQLDSYDDYIRFLASNAGQDEIQVAVDLITTNETYFFRESKHFDFLSAHVLPKCPPGRLFRVWSAACSSGEEPYSLAMLLAENLSTTPWEITASDLSTRILARAASGHYAIERATHIPGKLLMNYCLKGIGTQEGTFVVDPKLRNRISFLQVNLNKPLPNLGEFDLIFLRNVMIYFDMEVKRAVVNRMLPLLKPGGHFIVGHSESLNGVTEKLTAVFPSIYRKQ